MNPEDTRAKHGIPTYPIRHWTWSFGQPVQQAGDSSPAKPSLKGKAKAAVRRSPFLVRTLKAIKAVLVRMPKFVFKEVTLLIHRFRMVRSLDVLVVSGGAQLADSSGPWDMPYAVFKWVMLANLGRTKCIVLNVGAGPVDSWISQYFVRKILFSADYVSFRDEESLAVARRIGFTGIAYVFPDNAYALEIPAGNMSPIRELSAPTVGIAPTVYNPKLAGSVLDALGHFGSWLIRNNYCVALFCSHISVDPEAVEKLESILTAQNATASTSPGDPLCRVHQWSAEETLANMSFMDYVTTCRFHGVIMAHLLKKPVLTISDCRRTTALMSDLGLSQYCVEIGECDEAKLEQAFLSLVSNRDKVENRLAETLEQYRRRLEAQFDELFPYGPISVAGGIGMASGLAGQDRRIAG